MALAEAREAWRKVRAEIAEGRDPTVRRPSMAVAALVQEWLERDQAKNRSHRAVERMVEKHILPAWQHRSIAEIGRRDVLDAVDAVADHGTVIMARRVQSAIHRLLTWCVKRGIIEANPAAGLDKPGAEHPRDRVLTDAELVAVWRAADELGWPYGTATQMLALTEARREEIGQLRWSEISGDEISLPRARTKGGTPHTIPLSNAALALLENVPRIVGSDFVFSTTGRTAGGNWARAKTHIDELTKIPPWRVHDLRRTVATGLQKMGVNLQVTEAVLGHTTGSRAGIVGVYQRHDYAKEKREALEAWGAHVMTLIGKGSG
jgi:integrase